MCPMKVKRIDLDDNEMPDHVLVELTHDEAVFVALLVGRMNGAAAEETLPGGAALVTSLHDGLTGGLFNRFYEDGVQDAARAVRRS
jgi:hypothetical protein